MNIKEAKDHDYFENVIKKLDINKLIGNGVSNHTYDSSEL